MLQADDRILTDFTRRSKLLLSSSRNALRKIDQCSILDSMRSLQVGNVLPMEIWFTGLELSIEIYEVSTECESEDMLIRAQQGQIDINEHSIQPTKEKERENPSMQLLF